ncbi:MAG: DUF2252 family protein, partial [Spirochaetota bacterium]
MLTQEVLFESSLHNLTISTADRKRKAELLASSAFVFYRGNNPLFYRQLAERNCIFSSEFYSEATKVWILGDMHIGNFGSFTLGEEIIYHVNDFDEAWLTSYLFDIYRLSCSLLLLCQEQSIAEQESKNLLFELLQCYTDTVQEYPKLRHFRLVEKEAYGKLDEFLAEVKEENSREILLDKWTEKTQNKRNFLCASEKEKLQNTSEAELNDIKQSTHSYLQEKGLLLYDCKKRVFAGVGSYGIKRYYLLVASPGALLDEYHILELKKQVLPSVCKYLSQEDVEALTQKFSCQAERAVVAQNIMLAEKQSYLTDITLSDASYLLRERSPYKESFPLHKLHSYKRIAKMSQQWAKLAALAHCHSDCKQGAFAMKHSFYEEFSTLICS